MSRNKSRCVLIAVCSISLVILWLTCVNYYVDKESRLIKEKLYEALQAKLLSKARVNISVYYESLCDDSQSFFVSQLLPAYLTFEDDIYIDLIPYGKSHTRIEGGKLKFDCQHGATECLGNKIHACAIHIIQDPSIKIQFITCLISYSEDQIKSGSTCAVMYGVSWDDMLTCANGPQGDLLYKNHGERTQMLNPRILFVPTVLLNNKRHSQSQMDILDNLHGQLCARYEDVLKQC